MDKEIYIIGAGTYGAVIYELATLNNFTVKGFYDDDINKIGKSLYNVKVLDKIDISNIDCKKKNFAVAIGNNKLRNKLCNEILQNGGILPTLIHPKAEISKNATIGIGCFIHANTYIWTEAVIKDFTIISPQVIIAHHTVIHKSCFVSAGSNIGAGLAINELSFIGIGATIMTGINYLGRNITVGAGSVVIKDIEDNSVVIGNPARVLKK